MSVLTKICSTCMWMFLIEFILLLLYFIFKSGEILKATLCKQMKDRFDMMNENQLLQQELQELLIDDMI